MLRPRYLHSISLVFLATFLLACSGENNSRAEDTQHARTLKAKIVYFSIPG
jgi:hypothetical protein